jgi:hypothetical protein
MRVGISFSPRWSLLSGAPEESLLYISTSVAMSIKQRRRISFNEMGPCRSLCGTLDPVWGTQILRFLPCFGIDFRLTCSNHIDFLFTAVFLFNVGFWRHEATVLP